MSRTPPEPDGERPPSWAGAPGYQPHRELPPHAPMPGAPPYPATEDHPPPRVGERAPGTRLRSVLLAATVAAVLNLLLELAVNGPSGVARTAGPIVLVGAVTAGLLWLGVRNRRWPTTLLLPTAVLGYFVLRALSTLIVG